MKKVYMVEYQGRCDENGVAVGHAPKVITEYYDFIKDICDVWVLAPKTILNSIKDSDIKNKKVLPHHIIMKGKTPFLEKITNKLGMFKNLSSAIKTAEKDGVDTLWFFNVEYYIMLYFAFKRKPNIKIVLTMFIDGYKPSKNASIKTKIVNSIKHFIFEKAQKKFDLIISTGKKFEYKNCNHEFIPDYYYDTEKFDKYTNNAKEETAVCLGTMGRGKQLSEMIDAFIRINYPLHIAGRFYDKELVKELNLKIAGCNNITIDDNYLSTEEYLNLLSKAKFTVLPYPEENYSHQTSGVMQEAIFLRTVPVTYSSILDGNCALGVGFKTWDNLTRPMLEEQVDSIISKYNDEIDTTYNFENIKQKYFSIFK